MTSPWYRYGDQPPPRVVKVRVLWEGREFVAARVLDEKTGKEFWGEYKLKANGKLSADPTPVTLGGAPELWRPLHAELWKGRLPPPVTLAEAGRMHAERMSFALVEEASAAELAAEMERDRRDANVSRATLNGGKGFESQWWRDIAYSGVGPDGKPKKGKPWISHTEQAPDITLKSVEGRLMRAVYACDAPQGRGARTSSALRELDDALQQAMRELAENESKLTPDFVPRMQSAPRDGDDFLIAMAWFVALYPPEQRPRNWARRRGIDKFNRPQKVIIWRALNIPWSYAEIGEELKISGERARQIFKDAIAEAHRVANGQPLRTPRRDLMAEVRERNRRAKREARA